MINQLNKASEDRLEQLRYTSVCSHLTPKDREAIKLMVGDVGGSKCETYSTGCAVFVPQTSATGPVVAVCTMHDPLGSGSQSLCSLCRPPHRQWDRLPFTSHHGELVPEAQKRRTGLLGLSHLTVGNPLQQVTPMARIDLLFRSLELSPLKNNHAGIRYFRRGVPRRDSTDSDRLFNITPRGKPTFFWQI